MFDTFVRIHLFLDSAAARGIVNRRGVGKVRIYLAGVSGSKNGKWPMIVSQNTGIEEAS